VGDRRGGGRDQVSSKIKMMMRMTVPMPMYMLASEWVSRAVGGLW
jgi:hypothetical protein